jgi:serine/threonine protein kinase
LSQNGKTAGSIAKKEEITNYLQNISTSDLVQVRQSVQRVKTRLTKERDQYKQKTEQLQKQNDDLKNRDISDLLNSISEKLHFDVSDQNKFRTDSATVNQINRLMHTDRIEVKRVCDHILETSEPDINDFNKMDLLISGRVEELDHLKVMCNECITDGKKQEVKLESIVQQFSNRLLGDLLNERVVDQWRLSLENIRSEIVHVTTIVDQIESDKTVIKQADNIENNLKEQAKNLVQIKKKVSNLQNDLEAAEVEEDDEQIERVEKKLNQANEELHQQKRLIEKQQSDLVALTKDNFPDYIVRIKIPARARGKKMDDKERMINFMKRMNVYVDRSLNDYNVIHSESNNGTLLVYATLKQSNSNQQIVLKGQTLASTTEKRLRNELRVLSNVDHPAVVPIDVVFYSESKVFIQMKLYDNGNLHDWIKGYKPSLPRMSLEALLQKENKREYEEIRVVLRQIIQGLAYLHSKSIVHRDIKPQNILIDVSGSAHICDFGISRNLESHLNTTLNTNLSAGTNRYMAPELLSHNRQGIDLFKCDMYSLGVLIFDCFMKYNPAVTVNAQQLKDKYGDKVDLIDLVDNLLSSNSDIRLSAQHCMYHPFFTKDSSSDLQRDRRIISSETKLKLMNQYIMNMTRQITGNAITIPAVQRSNIDHAFKIVCGILVQLDHPSKLVSKWYVRFENETGIDQGGLTEDLITLVTQHALSTLFEKGEEGTFIPTDSPLTNELSQRYIGFGRLLSKCIVDKRSLDLNLLPFVFKYLVTVNEPMTRNQWFREVELFDYNLVKGWRQLMQYDNETLENLGLEFDGTDTGLIDLAQQKLYGENGNRKKKLDLMREGFKFCDAELYESFIKNLNGYELMQLLCGQSFIDASKILNNILLERVPVQIRNFFVQFIQECSENELRLFLKFTTGSPTLPYNGLPKKITIYSTSRFYAHTCITVLSLEVNGTLNNYDLFRRDFMYAVINGASAEMME